MTTNTDPCRGRRFVFGTLQVQIATLFAILSVYQHPMLGENHHAGRQVILEDLHRSHVLLPQHPDDSPAERVLRAGKSKKAVVAVR